MTSKDCRLSSYDNFSLPTSSNDNLLTSEKPLNRFIAPIYNTYDSQTDATTSNLPVSTFSTTESLNLCNKSDAFELELLRARRRNLNVKKPYFNIVASPKAPSVKGFQLDRNSSVVPAETCAIPCPMDLYKGLDSGYFIKRRSNSSSSTTTAQTTISTQSTVADSIICATSKEVPFYKTVSNYETKIFDSDAHLRGTQRSLNSSTSSLSASSHASQLSSASSSFSTSIFNHSYSKSSNSVARKQQDSNWQIKSAISNNSSLSEDNDDTSSGDNTSKKLFLRHENSHKRYCNQYKSDGDLLQSFIIVGKNNRTKHSTKLTKINNQLVLKWPIVKQISKNGSSRRPILKKKQKFVHSCISSFILLFLTVFLLLVIFGLFLLLFRHKAFDLFESYGQTFDYTFGDTLNGNNRKSMNTNSGDDKSMDLRNSLTKKKTKIKYSMYNTLRSTPYDVNVSDDWEKNNETSRKLMELFDPEKIRDNLHFIASKIHVAGTPEQLELMDRLEEQYRNLNFEVESFEYDVLLSYPDYNHPNTIEMWSDYEADWQLISNGLAERLGSDDALKQQEDPRGLVWWNAYSQNGSASGQIVYVNYGTAEDYRMLEKLNISLSGKIALMRYGSLFRGDKALMAEEKGALGVILYSDPYDFAPDLAKDNKTFPDKIWLPSSGAQRGTLLRTVGDPETPFLPSKPYVYRHLTEAELRKSKILPNIPITSIGYRDAFKIFENLNGIESPWSGWRGLLDVQYRVTGQALFQLNVNSQTMRRKIKNFIAVMHGAEEPDKWVLMGNHADAWVQGAIDPGTATATMLEMARVLSTYAEQNAWRPRRTICFCQWDAEEFGLIGSTEWIEENLRLLENKAIAYINVDNINGNSTLEIKAVPLLYRVTTDAASRVQHPLLSNSLTRNYDSGKTNKEPFQTLLDAWRFYSPKGPLPGDRSVPGIQLPVSGSDFQRFITFAGVPVIDLKLENAPIYSYMLYHSMYEIPWVVETLIDPSFHACTAMGQMWLELGRSLADSLLIPFNVEDYGIMLNEFLVKIHYQLLHMRIDLALGKDFFREKMESLQTAISDFQKHSIQLQHIVQAVNAGDISLTLRQARMLNDRLQNVERAFVLDDGIFPERPFFRHSVLTPSENELYAGVAFALILDPAFKWWELTKPRINSKGKRDLEKRFKRIKKIKGETKHEIEHWLSTIRFGFSKLQYTIESATKILKLDGF